MHSSEVERERGRADVRYPANLFTITLFSHLYLYLKIKFRTLNAGDYFGEMALMLNETRHANCIAIGEVQCLSLDRNKFNMLLGSVQDLLARRMRIRILQSVPLLSKLPENKLVRLAGVMRVQAFSPGQYIIRQGEEGSRFYIINEGEVRCTRSVSASQEEELIRLCPQEFFGIDIFCFCYTVL